MLPERAISHGLSGINKGPVINRRKIRREEDSRSGISEDWSRTTTFLTRMYITSHNPRVMVVYTPGTKSHLNCPPRIGHFVVKTFIFVVKYYSFAKSFIYFFLGVQLSEQVSKIMFRWFLELDGKGVLAITLKYIKYYQKNHHILRPFKIGT